MWGFLTERPCVCLTFRLASDLGKRLCTLCSIYVYLFICRTAIWHFVFNFRGQAAPLCIPACTSFLFFITNMFSPHLRTFVLQRISSKFQGRTERFSKFSNLDIAVFIPNSMIILYHVSRDNCCMTFYTNIGCECCWIFT